MLKRFRSTARKCRSVSSIVTIIVITWKSNNEEIKRNRKHNFLSWWDLKENYALCVCVCVCVCVRERERESIQASLVEWVGEERLRLLAIVTRRERYRQWTLAGEHSLSALGKKLVLGILGENDLASKVLVILEENDRALMG